MLEVKAVIKAKTKYAKALKAYNIMFEKAKEKLDKQYELVKIAEQEYKTAKSALDERINNEAGD